MAQELTRADYEKFITDLEEEKKKINLTKDAAVLMNTARRITTILGNATANRELTNEIYPCASRLRNHTASWEQYGRPNDNLIRQAASGLCGNIDEIIDLLKRYYNQAPTNNSNGSPQPTDVYDRAFNREYAGGAKTYPDPTGNNPDTQGGRDTNSQYKGDPGNASVDVGKLKADLAQAISERDQAREANDRARASVSEERGKREKLEAERDSWKATADANQMSLTQANFRAEKSAGETESALTLAKEAQDKLTTEQGKVVSLTQQVTNSSIELNRLNKAVADMTQKLALLEAEEKKSEPEQVRRALLENLDALPPTFRQYAEGLLEVTERAEQRASDWLADNLDNLSKFVYTPPVLTEMLLSTDEDPLKQDQSRLAARLLFLQQRVHQLLLAAGIAPIAPAVGESFNLNLHDFSDRDLMWISQPASLNNCVHSVLRVGFQDTRKNRVLRKAAVKRYALLAGSEAIAEPPVTPPSAVNPIRQTEPTKPAAFDPLANAAPVLETVAASITANPAPEPVPDAPAPTVPTDTTMPPTTIGNVDQSFVTAPSLGSDVADARAFDTLPKTGIEPVETPLSSNSSEYRQAASDTLPEFREQPKADTRPPQPVVTVPPAVPPTAAIPEAPVMKITDDDDDDLDALLQSTFVGSKSTS